MPDKRPDRYIEATAESEALYQEACEYMPGGNTRNAVYAPPYPLYLSDGEGCRVSDVDGNEYIDFQNNMTSLVHGHCQPDLTDEAIAALEQGSALGGPTQTEVEWAKHFCERVPAVDKIRFTNSGTEATMNAIRAARAHTGNDLIAKFEGTYHGTHNDVQISVDPPIHLAGSGSDPEAVPDSAGVPDATVDDVIVLPFNDPEATRSKIEDHSEELAGVMIAPLMGSTLIPASDRFM
jgi:glutamate-1-semialdehyde 2,1-aminomutase